MKKIKYIGFLLSFFFLISCKLNASSNVEEVKLTGVYSDMCYIPESGDVIGIELIISYTGKVYSVVFQSSEGVPRTPIVTLLRDTGKEFFEIELNEKNGYVGQLQGTFKSDGFYGSFKNGQLGPHGDDSFFLKRQSSIWEHSPHRNCESNGVRAN